MSESFNQQNLDLSALTFDEHGLIPAIVQDENDGAVLMMAYMDKESLRRTLKEGRAWFFSRSRQSYWLKGESSGNIVRVSRVSIDCSICSCRCWRPWPLWALGRSCSNCWAPTRLSLIAHY